MQSFHVQVEDDKQTKSPICSGGDPVVKVRGLGGAQPPPPASTLAEFGPLQESEPSLSTAGPKLLNSTKNHNVRCRINKF